MSVMYDTDCEGIGRVVFAYTIGKASAEREYGEEGPVVSAGKVYRR